MPHLTLEYTGNIEQEIDFDDLFGKLHRILAGVGAIRLDNCKSRAWRLDHYYIADGGAQHAFVHLVMRFLAGRPRELKQEIGRQSLTILKEAFAPSLAELELQISVEIQDIERSTYLKAPEGTF
jgi:5-carboxymethyl-2-hydroxymuconate isomerase